MCRPYIGCRKYVQPVNVSDSAIQTRRRRFRCCPAQRSMPPSVYSLASATSGPFDEEADDLDDFFADAPEAAEGRRPRQKRAEKRLRKVSFVLSKPCKCSLCNSSSTDASPLLSSDPADSWGGKRPWGKYRPDVKDKDGEAWAVPEGRLCLLCKCVFKLLGLAHAHGGFKKYAEKVKAKTVDHTDFLASLAEWIKSHNKDPSKGRMDQAQRAAVKSAKQTLTSEQEAGVVFEAPETFFVEVDAWDKAAYGELDESKVEEKFMFGRMVKGAYVQTGKKGHYKVQDFEKKSHVHATEEHDGQQEMFNDSSLATKKKAVSAAFAEAQAERRTSAAQAKQAQTALDMDSILALIGQAGSAQESQSSDKQAQGLTAASGQALGVKVEEASESSSESEAAPVAERLGIKKAKAKAKAKPASSSKSGQAQLVPAKAEPDPPLPRAKSEKPAQSDVASRPAAEHGHATVMLDGRGLRLKGTVSKQLEEFRRKFTPLLLFDESYNWGDKKAQHGRQKSLSSLSNHVAALLKKIEDSPNKAGLAEELSQLDKLGEAVKAAMVLNAELGSAMAKATEMQNALEVIGNMATCSKDVYFKIWEAKCAELMLFRNLAACCQAFAEDSPEAPCSIKLLNIIITVY